MADDPRVLVIANERADRHKLERALSALAATRSIGAVAETEGRGADVVVIGGTFPIAGLMEVRAHPRLAHKPVVLFAPCADLPEMDWHAAMVWPVTSDEDALEELSTHVRYLLASTPPDAL
jgi:hypothetical protein